MPADAFFLFLFSLQKKQIFAHGQLKRDETTLRLSV